MEIEEVVKQISISYLEKLPVYEQLEKYFYQIRNVQEIVCSSDADCDNDELQMIKKGTILSLVIVSKMARGSDPRKFTDKEWGQIAGEVQKQENILDGQKYSVYVFETYAKYIDVSIKIWNSFFSDRVVEEIKGLSAELKELTSSFLSGEFAEADYIEKGLWICFEAMIKLLSAFFTSPLPGEYPELFQSAADFAVQYARLSIYRKEQELLELYLKGQKVLDDELQKKFEEYVSELKTQAEQFNSLIDKAFDPNFRRELRYSLELARSAGVKEEDILDSVGKVDDYFS